MKVTLEIEDSLQERVDSTVSESVERAIQYMNDNDDFDTYYGMSANDLIEKSLRYDGTFYEIVDSNTPIYYSDIDGIYYLHSNVLEEAYNNAGIYNEQPDNYRQVCIYLYIEQEAWPLIEEKIEEIKSEMDDIRDGMVESSDEEIEEKQREFLDEYSV